jgi:hypothetical protein
MSTSPTTVRPWIKRELASYRPGIDAFAGLREPTRRDVERAQVELKLARLDAEIAVQREIVHAERTQRLQRLGIDTTNYRPLRDAPTRGAGGRVIRRRLGVVTGIR